jgi:hypothetical protein
MGNYYPILMQIGIETGMLSSKITTAKVYGHLQDGRRCRFGNLSECFKISNYHPILMKIGTQTKKNMPSSEITKAEV